MRLWLDTEFNGFKGELIGLALVDEAGREWYEVLKCKDPVPWSRPMSCLSYTGGQRHQSASRSPWQLGFASTTPSTYWPTGPTTRSLLLGAMGLSFFRVDRCNLGTSLTNQATAGEIASGLRIAAFCQTATTAQTARSIDLGSNLQLDGTFLDFDPISPCNSLSSIKCLWLHQRARDDA